MATRVDVANLSDANLAEEFLNRNLLSPGQLKAALDYQASVGGRISVVVVKLGLTKAEVLHDFLERLADGEDFVLDDDEKSGAKRRVRLPEFDVASLRVHKKLLDKAPAELVSRCGILVFFPPSGTRAILLSSEPPLSPLGVQRLEQLLCVELIQITLTEAERAALREGRKPESRLIGGNSERKQRGAAGKAARAEPGELDPPTESARISEPEAGQRPASKSAPAARAAAQNAKKSLNPYHSTREIAEDSEILVQALIRLLIKKGVISQDELVVEAKLEVRKKMTESSTH